MPPDSCEGDLCHTQSSTKAVQVHQSGKKHLKVFKGIISSVFQQWRCTKNTDSEIKRTWEKKSIRKRAPTHNDWDCNKKLHPALSLNYSITFICSLLGSVTLVAHFLLIWVRAEIPEVISNTSYYIGDIEWKFIPQNITATRVWF